MAGKSVSARLAAINATIPMRRAGTAGEVAAMVMTWVASSKARYATGAVFAIDGGMTAI